MRIFTVGHSTRSVDQLAAMLRAFGVTVLADIRTIPRSRRNPQFSADALGPALAALRIRYVRVPKLGGLRRARQDSTNAGWLNASFRGFADYMLTDEFEAGLLELRSLAAEGVVSLMCAEAVPWRCHRSLVADALIVRGAQVEHIASERRASSHQLTPFAKVEGTRITYPADRIGHLPTQAPFQVEATVRVLQRRPINVVDVWEQHRYRRVLATAQGLALVEVQNHGSVDEPDVRFRLLQGTVSAANHGLADRMLRNMLGLDVDPEPLHRLASAEPGLKTVAAALRGMRPPRFATLFEAFVNTVPFQQVSLDAGAAIVRRIVERFGTRVDHEGRHYYAFPEACTVAAASADELVACGCSLKKAQSLCHIAQAVDSGEVTEDHLSCMSSAQAIDRLTQLPGIGPWSASLVLLRGLRRLDVFPPSDAGAERGLRRLLPRRASIDRALRRFGDCRGYLYFCLLGASLLGKDLIHAADQKRPRATE